MEINSVSSTLPVFPLQPKTQDEPENSSEKNSQIPGLSNRSKKELNEMIKGVNELMIPSHTSSKFVLHEKLNDYYVQVINDDTKEILHEFPSKKFLDMYASMMDYVGLFIDKKI